MLINTSNITNKGDTVDSTSEAYDDMRQDWELPVALMGGEKVMKAYKTTYLPKEPMETDEQYLNRLERSTLKNYFAWAVENHTGRVFNKSIMLSEDTPEIIKEYNKNLNLMGSDINNFYRDVFRDMLIKGISYIYVDFPRPDIDLSLAEELEMGYRPYAIHLKAEQVIRAIPRVVNGNVVLGRAHVYEEVLEPYGSWGVKTVPQVRVLYPGSWELYRLNDGNSWDLYDQGETSLDYIPLIPVYGKKVGFFHAKSPLLNLANLNRAHWQSMSDQMNITHVARVPILFGTGFDEEDSLVVGSKSAILGPTGSELSYVEHTGKAIDSGMNELKDLEERMAIESLELIKDSSTATGQALDTSDLNCSLQDLALRLQDSITQVNNIMCDWEEIERVGEAIVNTDFGLHLRDGSEANVLLKTRQNGSISIETLHKELKRRGVLSPDFDSPADIKRLEDAKELGVEKPYIDENGNQIMDDDNARDLDTGKPRVE